MPEQQGVEPAGLVEVFCVSEYILDIPAKIRSRRH